MSEIINPPEYYFTGIDFNPDFYENNLSLEDQALLDARYVKFPIAQNAPITFTATVRGITAVVTENSTIIATTQWVQNYFNYVKTIANTWSGLQTFTLGMVTNTINPTTPSGTLIIGNQAVNTNVEVATQTGRTAVLRLGDGTGSTTSGGIHIGNGLASTNAVNILYSYTDAGSSGIINLGAVNGTVNLRCPLTPLYTYPVTSTQIGYIQSVSPSPVAYPTLNADVVLASLTLLEGTWLLVGEAGLDIASNNVITAGINTTTSLTSARALQSMNFNGSSTSQPAITINYILTINASTTYNFIGRSGLAISPAYNFNGIVFSATRLS